MCSEIWLHQHTCLTPLHSWEGKNILKDSFTGSQGTAWPRSKVLVSHAEAFWANSKSSFITAVSAVSAWGTQNQTGDRRWEGVFSDWTQTVECTPVVQSCDTVDSFKMKLKTFLLSWQWKRTLYLFLILFYMLNLLYGVSSISYFSLCVDVSLL